MGELEKRGVWASGGFEVEWIVDVNDTTTFGSGELPDADTNRVTVSIRKDHDTYKYKQNNEMRNTNQKYES